MVTPSNASMNRLVADTPKASYLQWLGVMVSYDLSELRAARMYIKLLLDPMEQMVSHVSDGHPTLPVKGVQESDLLKTDPLCKTYSKRHLIRLEIEIHLIYLEILP